MRAERARVRSAARVCKPPVRVVGPCLLGVVLALTACSTAPHAATLTLADLESGQTRLPLESRRTLVADMRELRPLLTPLGPRLALVRVRDAEDWRRLRSAAPQVGTCPDLRRGIVVGLASMAGTPADGAWPIELFVARLRDGAGLVCGFFRGGTYLPDGTTYLETAQIDGLRDVLVVDVNGTKFYPD